MLRIEKVSKGASRRVYKDKDIEGELIAQGLLVPMRTEEVVKRFSEIGCQVSAAHPGLEISR